ncbi:MAG: hypothetical protein ACLRWP_13315 [Bilophila wadsworthia]
MYAFGLTKAAGTGLVFETMPAVFAHLPGGWFLSAGFFFLLIISGFASGLGLVEGVVGTLDEAWKLGRNKTLFLVLAAVLLLSLPPLLSYGAHAPWASIRLWDRSIFVFAEYVVTALLMPVRSLADERLCGPEIWLLQICGGSQQGRCGLLPRHSKLETIYRGGGSRCGRNDPAAGYTDLSVAKKQRSLYVDIWKYRLRQYGEPF